VAKPKAPLICGDCDIPMTCEAVEDDGDESRR
jgi:hypothetical protein